MDLEFLNLRQLRKELKRHGLSPSGLKADLVDRLKEVATGSDIAAAASLARDSMPSSSDERSPSASSPRKSDSEEHNQRTGNGFARNSQQSIQHSPNGAGHLTNGLHDNIITASVTLPQKRIRREPERGTAVLETPSDSAVDAFTNGSPPTLQLTLTSPLDSAKSEDSLASELLYRPDSDTRSHEPKPNRKRQRQSSADANSRNANNSSVVESPAHFERHLDGIANPAESREELSDSSPAERAGSLSNPSASTPSASSSSYATTTLNQENPLDGPGVTEDPVVSGERLPRRDYRAEREKKALEYEQRRHQEMMELQPHQRTRQKPVVQYVPTLRPNRKPDPARQSPLASPSLVNQLPPFPVPSLPTLNNSPSPSPRPHLSTSPSLGHLSPDDTKKLGRNEMLRRKRERERERRAQRKVDAAKRLTHQGHPTNPNKRPKTSAFAVSKQREREREREREHERERETGFSDRSEEEASIAKLNFITEEGSSVVAPSLEDPHLAKPMLDGVAVPMTQEQMDAEIKKLFIAMLPPAALRLQSRNGRVRAVTALLPTSEEPDSPSSTPSDPSLPVILPIVPPKPSVAAAASEIPGNMTAVNERGDEYEQRMGTQEEREQAIHVLHPAEQGEKEASEDDTTTSIALRWQRDWRKRDRQDVALKTPLLRACEVNFFQLAAHEYDRARELRHRDDELKHLKRTLRQLEREMEEKHTRIHDLRQKLRTEQHVAECVNSLLAKSQEGPIDINTLRSCHHGTFHSLEDIPPPTTKPSRRATLTSSKNAAMALNNFTQVKSATVTHAAQQPSRPGPTEPVADRPTPFSSWTSAPTSTAPTPTPTPTPTLLLGGQLLPAPSGFTGFMGAQPSQPNSGLHLPTLSLGFPFPQHNFSRGLFSVSPPPSFASAQPGPAKGAPDQPTNS